ncbi:DUF7109 family protein [Halegenticoccus soli]|uniref:DUF7109 family protein n=1 Tax=Halegenticoccus soli TaxID=1985678 RepID=UPI000C6D8787|nr:hypothetical protein [Halegenticoccus soli]
MGGGEPTGASPAAWDELAGVVDLFGALTRDELRRALDELAFKRGTDADPEALAAAIEDAVDAYYLVEYERTRASEGDDGRECGGTGERDEADGHDGADERGERGDSEDEPLLTPGPVAFPTLPENAEDLPHIMDVEPRRIDREALGRQVGERLLADAARAAAAGDDERMDRLLDVSYDLEAWAPVDVGSARERLNDALGRDGSGEKPEGLEELSDRKGS